MGGSSAPSIPQYGSFGTADQGAISGAGNIASAGQNTAQMFQNIAPGFQQSVAPTSYTPQQGVYAGRDITNSVSGLPGYANQALTAGFNPQTGLYQQELQQLQDQVRAGQSARGTAMTPYGAGVENQALTNFNNQWGQQQLANQGQAAQTAGSLLGTYEKGIGGGQALAQTAAQGGLQSLVQLLQAAGLSTAQQQQAVQDYLNYMAGGTQAASAQANAQNQADATSMGGLGGLGNLFGTVLTTPLKGTLLGGIL